MQQSSKSEKQSKWEPVPAWFRLVIKKTKQKKKNFIGWVWKFGSKMSQVQSNIYKWAACKNRTGIFPLQTFKTNAPEACLSQRRFKHNSCITTLHKINK